jgi:hypothetical protein
VDRGERDWTVDVVRIFSLSIVVLMHWTSTRVTVADGEVHTSLALHGPFAWAATWVLQVMPLFFLAGGFANTKVVDRCREKGQTYGEYLGLRVRRLTAPLVPLIAVFVLITLLLEASVSEQLAGTTAESVSRPLWFLAVYLVAVALAPLAVRAHDWSPWIVPAGLLAASLTVDAVRFAGHDDRFVYWNLLFVWLFCHQLGVLFARGTLRKVPDVALGLIGVAGVGLLVLMVIPGPYFPTILGLADAEVSNLAPPTSVISVLALVQLMVLMLVHRRIPRWQPSDSWRTRIETINALQMLIYLWHLPVLTALVGVGLLWPDVLLPSHEGLWWAQRPLWFLVGSVLLFGVVRLVMSWDIWCAGLGTTSSLPPAAVATVLSAAGIFVIWNQGLWLHTPSWLGVAAILGAATAVTQPRPATRPVPAP